MAGPGSARRRRLRLRVHGLFKRWPRHLVLMTDQNLEFVLGSAPANSRSVPAMAGATRAGVGLRAGELANAQRSEVSSQPKRCGARHSGSGPPGSTEPSRRDEAQIWRACATRGVHVPATEVDHCVEHGGDWNQFVLGAKQSLCSACHRNKSAHAHRKSQGFDERGEPLDPAHPWNRRQYYFRGRGGGRETRNPS
jgi:hypothetical protein